MSTHLDGNREWLLSAAGMIDETTFWVSEYFHQDSDLYEAEAMMRHLAFQHCRPDSAGEDMLMRAAARLEARRRWQSFRPNIAVDAAIFKGLRGGPSFDWHLDCP